MRFDLSQMTGSTCARERREMSHHTSPTKPIRLFRFTETVARKMAEDYEGLRDEEAKLRAAIAWAKYARTAHLKIAERAKTCPKLRIFVEPARRRRIRAAQHLRLRLTAVIPRKLGLMREAQA